MRVKIMIHKLYGHQNYGHAEWDWEYTHNIEYMFWEQLWSRCGAVVVAGLGPGLVGRYWIRREVFRDKLGNSIASQLRCMWTRKQPPGFLKPGLSPYAMRGRAEAEVNCLAAQRMIEPVKHAEWAVVVVPVLKPGDSAGLCGETETNWVYVRNQNWSSIQYKVVRSSLPAFQVAWRSQN